jgi:hypothetical protein
MSMRMGIVMAAIMVFGPIGVPLQSRVLATLAHLDPALFQSQGKCTMCHFLAYVSLPSSNSDKLHPMRFRSETKVSKE